MSTELTPFRIEVSQAEVADLGERLRRTRWPEPETVGDWSQGVPCLTTSCCIGCRGPAPRPRGCTGSISQVNEWISGAATDPVTVPVGCSIFPKEIFRPSRRWADKQLTNVQYWNELDKGGHFAAFEQPETFVSEVRACFRSLR